LSLHEQLESLKTAEDLRKLVVEHMNFSLASGSVLNNISPSIRSSLRAADIIAEQDDFKVIHCDLNKLLKGNERPVIEQLSKYFQHNLVVFSDADCNEFHFTSIRPLRKEKELIKDRSQPFRRFVVGANERLRTAGERLGLLILDGDEKGWEVQQKCDLAFDVEAVSRDFYKDFVEYYKGFRNLLMKENRLSQKVADEHTQTIFNRLFFLYFIQKKGYLNSDLRFITNYLQRTDAGNYYCDFILPLFRRLAEPDFIHPDLKQVPFLNGGLFEFLEAEKKLQIPNVAVKTIINGLFEHYNFTVREDTEFEKEIAIDPEMMGTIFERLILGLESKKFQDIPDARRATGSYYTPKFIVAFMVKQSLLNDLTTNLKDIPRQHLRELTFNRDTKNLSGAQLAAIRKRLLDIKIVDPAVGSGAYAVGVLLKIVEIIEMIDKVIEPDKPDGFNYRYNLKKEIIECCIYGVDIQERAVALSHLRLWLSLIVDLEVEDIVDVPPLPNLDFHILCGDSLVSNLVGYSYNVEQRIKTNQKELDLIEQFGQLKNRHSALTTQAEKIKSKAEMAKKKTAILVWFLSELIEEQERKIFNIEGKLGLFPENEVSKQKKLDLTKPHREKIEEIQVILENVGQLSEKFNWGLDFFDILILNSGFDIVIANPPYGVKVTNAIRDEFGVQNKDSYGVFTALGLKILKPCGTLCYIMSDTWQTIRTHKKLRDILLKEVDAQYLISLPTDVFAATVNTGVYSFVRRIKPRMKITDDADNWLLTADFSPLKIHYGDRWDSSDLEAAFELLVEQESFDDTRDGYTIESNREFAIFAYRQKLIPRFSNHSFFIANPKLFGLMRDVGNIKNPVRGENEAPVYSVEFNRKEIEIIKLGDISAIPQGLKTGDKSVIYKDKNARGPYKIAQEDKVFSEDDIKKFSLDEKNNGIETKKYGGRYLLSIDKGGASDTDSAWLPNYHVPTSYYIDWSKETVNRIKTQTIADRKIREGSKPDKNDYYKIASRFQGANYYFKQGISFSPTGVYSPTLRINTGHIFESKGSCIFLNTDKYDIYYLLGITASKLAKYIFKSFISHGVETGEGSFQIFVLPNSFKNFKKDIISIINHQKITPKYDYITNEQLEIDCLVYQMYNLNADDIEEVEDWYFRRYPKLANVIEAKLKAKAAPEA